MQIIPLFARVVTFTSIAMFGSLQASVVAIYSFDGDTVANRTDDISGNGNHGTANGAISYSSSNPFGTSGNSSFNVVSGRNVSAAGNTASFQEIGQQMTVSFWVQSGPDASTSWSRYIRKGPDSGSSNPDRTWMINRNAATFDVNTRIDTLGASGSQWNQNKAQQTSPAYGSNVLDGQWHLLTYVYTITNPLTSGGGRVFEYLDGVLTNTSGETFNPGDGLGNTHNLLFGSGIGGSAWAGLMDDLGIWSNALTTGEARSIYTLAKNSTFAYDLELVTQLHSLHALGQGGGPLLLNGYTWSYVDGLSGHAAGDLYLNGSNQWVLQLTGTTGLLAVPEPTRALLLCGGLLFALLRRRR